jgi:hypothetical protein
MLVVLPRLGDFDRALPELGWAFLQAILFPAAMILIGTAHAAVLKRIVRWGRASSS